MKRNLQLTIECLENAGFILNYEKSTVVPSKRLEFLGFMINMEKFTVSITERKLTSLRTCIAKALKKKRISIRQLSRIIGKIIATFPCCTEAPLHYRILDRYKIKMLRLNKSNWNCVITLSLKCLQELEW